MLAKAGSKSPIGSTASLNASLDTPRVTLTLAVILPLLIWELRSSTLRNGSTTKFTSLLPLMWVFTELSSITIPSDVSRTIGMKGPSMRML